MAYFYRRCTRGTRYRIVHENKGQHVFSAVRTHQPDAIVLDIMLPDIDGWELLSNLKEHPASRDIPVIVCSVIRERNLAAALGATACLHKPFQHHEFIAALRAALEKSEIEA
jgi:CheY-like chemotaxis protein